MGKSVAIVGAGGIGFDMAEFLAHGVDAQPMAQDRPHAMPSVASFLAEYGIDPTNTARGGLVANLEEEVKVEAKVEAGVAAEAGGGGAGGGGAGAVAAAAQGGGGGSQRQIFLLQRKTGKHGAGLGRTTGWIHRLDLRKMGVTMLGGVSYDKVAMLASLSLYSP